MSVAISLNEGTNNISLLSAMVGLPVHFHRMLTLALLLNALCTAPLRFNYLISVHLRKDSGAYLETKDFGPYKVIIQDKQGNKNLSSHLWGYQVFYYLVLQAQCN